MSLYLSKVVLRNVRGFQEAELDLGSAEAPRMWTVIIGNNGHGKSTLLRAIALGLCDEKTASALLLELPGEFIRRNKKGNLEAEARIELELTEGGKRAKVFRLITRVLPGESGEIIVRKEREGATSSSRRWWEEIFACGYGVNRGTRGTVSRDSYTMLEGLRSLFDDRVSLLDPESVLRDLKLRSYEEGDPHNGPLKQATQWLWKLWGMNLQLDVTARGGVLVHGPWGGGGMPFHALGDGYRGSAGVMLDLLGNAFKAGRWGNDEELRGIVLLDEVEEHLHPRWQKTIIPRLKKAFPEVQFIATTHSPLSLVNTEQGEVVATTLHNGIAQIDPDPLPSPEGKTANEILAEWFGVASTLDEESEKLLERYRKAVEAGDKEKAAELREKARVRIRTFFSTPMDDLAIQIAHEAREQIDAATTPEERKTRLQQLGAELRARLKAGKGL